ncbi:MAG: tetratricopeptide repeat protein [Oscillatoria sp. SIO1A7]|nr:tetratricopeptide repeat protein [Oscillatoria sp. SIO1A7]
MNDRRDQAYLYFIFAVFKKISESQGDPQVIYPLLQQHQHFLDENLIRVLNNWVAAILPTQEPKQAQFTAAVINEFGNLIGQFPLGSKANNMEIAIACYEKVLQICTHSAFPKQWASTQNNLASAYRNRIKGEREHNLEEAIACYERASQFFTLLAFPEQWASTQNNLASAYLYRIKGERADNLEEAIACYQRALQILTLLAFPEQWASTQNNLASAYLDRIKGERANNLELAIACYERALQVYTPSAFPKDWALTQYNLASGYLYRIKGERADNLEEAIACYEKVLQVCTHSAFPEQWASTQNNLASAYRNRIKGERADNLEEAIACYQRASQFFALLAFPEQWASTQNNLASAYLDRIKGERADNLEEAIACYEKVLQVCTHSAFPKQWASIQNNLASAYRNRIKGEREHNLEKAIACYEKVCTHSAFPEQWAITQNNLGSIYLDRIKGERADNLEEAIACCERALQVLTPWFLPKQWAMTQNNLGNAYSNRIKGERAEDLEEAIACFERALQIRTYSAFPEDWATTQNNLGNAYSNRIKGERGDNLERAIACYERALQIRTPSTFPEDWATTQNNLGNAYLYRRTGERGHNLEQAIRCCEVALQIRTPSAFPKDWAMTQNNLGLAYSDRIQGERGDNLEKAIACYEGVLQVYTPSAFPEQWTATQNNLGSAYLYRIKGERGDNLERAIACYERALQIRTPSTFPEQWAATQNNLGSAYKELGKTPAAIRCFRLALEIHSPAAFPLDSLRAGRNLGNLGFTAGDWEVAIEGYGLAIKAVEQSRNWATSDASRQEIIADAIDVYEQMVQACVNSGQLDRALETVERSRSKRLVDLMASNDLYRGGEIPSEVEEYLNQYQNLQKEIDRERRRYEIDNSPELAGFGTSRRRERVGRAPDDPRLAELEAQKQEIWQQLRRKDPVLAGQIQVNPLDFGQLQQLLGGERETAILSFYSTSKDSYIFILRYQPEEDRVSVSVRSCGDRGYDFQNWILKQWLKAYVEDNPRWQSQMESVLAELAERLQLDELVEEHLAGIQELILVPHLYLHQIPFAALPLTGGKYCKQDLGISPLSGRGDSRIAPAHKTIGVSPTKYLGDRFRIRTVPSCQVLQFCQNRPPAIVSKYGTVEDATEDLPCARFEGERIARLYDIPASQRLQGRRQATVSNYQRLARQVQSLHSSHHAQSRWDNPLESKLIVGDGDITLGQLMTPGWRLPELEEVFLSCCETGLGFAPITDDILTLAAGFLCAGARSVVSTLWAVDDLAAAVFSLLYYKYRRENLTRSAALQRAQQDLRQLTGDEFARDYGSELKAKLEESCREKLPELEAQYKEVQKQLWQAKKILKKSSLDSEREEWEQKIEELKKVGDSLHRAIRKFEKVQERLEAKCREPFPFAALQYWAAFVCQGMA